MESQAPTVKTFEECLDFIEEMGEFDHREEWGGNWRGHMGKVDLVEEDCIVFSRSWCDPFWGCNLERIRMERMKNGNTKVWLTPESDRGPWIKGKKVDQPFEAVVQQLADLGEKIQHGPTAVYRELNDIWCGNEYFG